VTAVVLGSISLAFLFRRTGKRPPVFGPVVRLIVVAGLILMTAFALGQAADRILPDYVDTEGSVDTVGALVDRASTGTDEGGSEIDRPLPTSPLDYPYAAFTVLFRPMIIEANSVGTLVAALETMVVLGLFLLSWRRLANLPAVLIRRPYVLMSLVYTGIFAFAWSSFANLGALARQRVQLWPFVLLLLAIPVAVDWAKEGRSVGPGKRGRTVDRGAIPRESQRPSLAASTARGGMAPGSTSRGDRR